MASGPSLIIERGLGALGKNFLQRANWSKLQLWQGPLTTHWSSGTNVKNGENIGSNGGQWVPVTRWEHVVSVPYSLGYGVCPDISKLCLFSFWKFSDLDWLWKITIQFELVVQYLQLINSMSYHIYKRKVPGTSRLPGSQDLLFHLNLLGDKCRLLRQSLVERGLTHNLMDLLCWPLFSFGARQSRVECPTWKFLGLALLT